jgi:dTDP-4-amino-4,6-dideoxygalactose transaminase
MALVEDACQAHAAALGNRPVGAFGAAGCFSFYPSKNMHSLEGGMITTADGQLARTLRMLRNQGMEQRYANEIVGANMRLTDVAAAVGREQLRKLPAWTEQRRANAELLDARLTGLRTPPVADRAHHVYHQYTVRVPGNGRWDRDRVQRALAARGVGSAVYYPTPVHRLKPYQGDEGRRPRAWDLPETERASAEVLSLPVYPTLTADELERIVRAANALDGPP